jgi:hypothetical protein
MCQPAKQTTTVKQLFENRYIIFNKGMNVQIYQTFLGVAGFGA